MRCRHTLPLLLLALSSILGLGLATHTRPHAHSRPSRTRKNHALEATTNSSVHFSLPESPGGHCPRGRRGPPPLSELRTMLDSYAPLDEFTPPRAPLTCLSAPHQPCPGDPCAPEGLCSPAGPDVRLRRARQLRLENCPHLTFFSVMSTEDRKALEDAASCCTLVRHLKERDATVRNFLDINDVLLRRSNFNNDCELGGPPRESDFYGGSPQKKRCVTCEEAYRRWVCSQLFVFHDGEGCPVKPCPSVCHCVEQKCPYFLPLYKPVAGEPSFFCEDYSVGFQEHDTMAHAHAHKSDSCYEPCTPQSSLGRLHERTNVTEFALCVHEVGRRKDSPPHASAGSQCLSDPGSDCGCISPSRQSGVVSGVPHHGILWTCLSLVALSRTLNLRPRGFT